MKFLLLFILMLTSLTANALKTTDNYFYVGKNAGADFTILHKDGGYLKKLGSLGSWVFSNDGILEKKIGSGSGSGGSGGVNLLLNNSFEDGLTNWTATGGTLTQETYTAGVEGDTKYARFVSTIAGQYVETDCYDKPDNFDIGGMADIKFKDGSGNFELKVFNCVAADIEISSDTLANISTWQKAPTQTFTNAAKMKLRLISTAAGTIDFDAGYLGSNKNISDIPAIEEQMSAFTYSSKASDNTIRFTTGLTGITEVLGDIFTYSDDGTAGTLLTFNKAADVTLTARLGNSSTQGFWIQLNGNNVTAETTAQSSPVDTGSATARLLVSSGDVLKVWGSTSTFNQGSMIVTAKTRVVKQSVFTPEQADFFVSAFITGANPSFATTATPTIVNHASLSLTNVKGSASIACEGATVSTGVNCSGANEQVGIVSYIPTPGKYRVCFSTSAYYTSEGTLRIGITEDGSDVIIDSSAENANSVGSDQKATRLCSHFDISTIGKKKFAIVYESNAGGGLIMEGSSSIGQYERNTTFTIELVVNNVSRPIIQNMVETSTSAGISTDICRFNNNGTTTIDTESGLCESWIVSSLNTGTGDITVVTSAKYGESAVCTCHPEDTNKFCGVVNVSGNTWAVQQRNYNTPVYNGPFILTCTTRR